MTPEKLKKHNNLVLVSHALEVLKSEAAIGLEIGNMTETEYEKAMESNKIWENFVVEKLKHIHA